MTSEQIAKARVTRFRISLACDGDAKGIWFSALAKDYRSRLMIRPDGSTWWDVR